jgi:hypothetical protein
MLGLTVSFALLIEKVEHNVSGTGFVSVHFVGVHYDLPANIFTTTATNYGYEFFSDFAEGGNTK